MAMIADAVFRDAISGLAKGDFSRMEPHFTVDSQSGESKPRIIAWHESGLFREFPAALAEAFTCACFLGRTDVAGYLLRQGIDAGGGSGTGLNAIHWAANRGQLEAVRLLIAHHVPLETRNMYGGTALGTTVWSAINEPRPDHLAIIAELIAAGAKLEEAGYPTGHVEVDNLLRQHGVV